MSNIKIIDNKQTIPRLTIESPLVSAATKEKIKLSDFATIAELYREVGNYAHPSIVYIKIPINNNLDCYFYTRRLETDEEYDSRIAQSLETPESEEARERATYERLRAKYEAKYEQDDGPLTSDQRDQLKQQVKQDYPNNSQKVSK